MVKPQITLYATDQVNPVGQVPALTYGGPDVPPSEPSEDSIKLRESHVLLELVTDLFPEAQLLPGDPVLRAKARLFPAESLLAVLEELQAMLQPIGFVAGQRSIADAAIIALPACEEVVFEHEMCEWKAGEGERVPDVLREPRFVHLAQYQRELEGRPAFKATFDKARI
ncbi:hypothetical protein CERSUDRAFT_72079 [Gelatoporia subvermispora B]|uniref:GST N-terminal domain-containing protein n=1 Tax=Ceriporiopsis subvermispora (strain B) TaxID=914234 RepID=M2RJZ8_CERS8|nr:hypothetical protein CERSUDRAFT_72079 [Gelatoporia subvermispora B]